jgi:hypothetical protein
MNVFGWSLRITAVTIGAFVFGFVAVAYWPDLAGLAFGQEAGQPEKKQPDKKKKTDKAKPPAQKAEEPAASVANVAVPSPEVLLIMVRSALSALDQANKTNNYSVLYALGSPVFQQNSPQQLSDQFINIRNANVDLQPALVLTPQITQPPGFTPEGLLVLNGLFPSQPLQIKFVVAYQPVGPVWRLAAVNLSLEPIKAAAAQKAEPAAAPAQ